MSASDDQRPWTIKVHPFHSPQGTALVAKLDTELLSMYPDWEDLIHPNIKPNPIPDSPEDSNLEADDAEKQHRMTFFVAFSTELPMSHAESAVGCVAIRKRSNIPGLPLGTRAGELKRMYVTQTSRGNGLAQGLLEAAEKYAKEELGLQKLVLETGCRQHAAIKLYERNGWKKIPTYGEYVGASVEEGGVSLCYEKKLR